MDEIIAATVTATQLHCASDHPFRKGKGKGLLMPYAIHFLQVLYRVQKWGIVEPTQDNIDFWKSVIFHDILEDTITTYHQLVEMIGKRAANIVLEVSHPPLLSKRDYLAGFSSKSIEAVVLKVSDRLSNVEDFMWSKPGKAIKYMRKADCVFDTMLKRRQEIYNRFGDGVWHMIQADCDIIETTLRGINESKKNH